MGLFAKQTYVPGEFLLNNRGLESLYQRNRLGRELLEYLLGEGIVVPAIGDETPRFADVLKRQREARTVGIPHNPEFAAELDRVGCHPHLYPVDDLHRCFSER